MTEKIKIKAIEKWLDEEIGSCADCGQLTFCNGAGIIENCEWVQDYSKYDLTKPGILIIDDNPGIVSFLEDDLEELTDSGLINVEDYNIFSFTTKNAAYIAFGTMRAYKNLNIQKAIIDITLGGSMVTSKGNIKLHGVDVFEALIEINPNLRYLFYTGNQMNSEVKTISDIMRQYSLLTGKKITDSLLFKTQLSMKDRRTFLYEKLFK